MYHAKERRTGQIIAAKKASPWGSYRCPTCNAEVSLRSGDYRVAHFAHKPGQGKPECDEFHPSEDLRHLWHNAQDSYQGPAIDPLRLSIELEPEYDSRRGPRKWVLRLTVPKSPYEHGLVQIDCGGGEVKKIALSKLVLGAQTLSC
jgi:Competence protein CoiA-like family